MAVTLRGSGQTIIQVQTTNNTQDWGSTSTAWVNTPLQCSITPTSSSNRILVFMSAKISTGSTGNDSFWRVVRSISAGGDAVIAPGIDGYTWQTAGQLREQSHSASFCFLDVPGTTNTVTYLFQARTSGPAMYYNARGFDGAFRVSSQMTLMEVAYV